MSQLLTLVEPKERSDAPGGSNQLRVFAVDHRTAPLALRERLSLAKDQRAKLISRLIEDHGCSEAFVLSTCLRTEVFTVGGANIVEAIAAVSGVDLAECLPVGTVWDKPREVAERLFRITSGMESVALGENQVVGQIKDAYQSAAELGAIGPVLGQLVERSIAVGREIRSNTSIGEGIVSIPSLAVHMARNAIGSLAGRCAVILGTGMMAHLSARHMAEAGLDLVFVSPSSPERAMALADEFTATALAYTTDNEFCREADIVICCTRTEQPMLTADHADALADPDRETPRLLIDLSVPRVVDPSVGELPGCRLINLDSMQGKCRAAKQRRLEACSQAEPMIETAVAEFAAWLSSREVAPTIQALLRRLGKIRDEEIERAMRSAGNERASVEKTTKSMIGRIANGAIQHLRRAAADGKAEEAIAHIRQVFDLG